MGCGSSKSIAVSSQTGKSVQRSSDVNNSVAVPRIGAVQTELKLEEVPECRPSDSSNSRRLDPCQTTCHTTMPHSDIDPAEGDKESVREACELQQVQAEADLPATSEEEGQVPSNAPSEGHTTSLGEEKGSLCEDDMGAGKSKRSVTSAARSHRGKSARSSSSLTSDRTRRSASLLERKDTSEGEDHRDGAKFDPGMLEHRPSGSQNVSFGICPSQPLRGQKEVCIHDDNSDMEKNRRSGKSGLPEERPLQEGQVVGGSLQEEIPIATTREKETALCCDSTSRSTTDFTCNSNEYDTRNTTISTENDLDESSTDFKATQHIEGTLTEAPYALLSVHVVSPKIRQLQEILGFVSRDSPGRDDTANRNQIKQLNPFDKQAAKDTNRLGLLKCPARGSSDLSPIDLD